MRSEAGELVKILYAVLAAIPYLGSIVAANWLIVRYGFIPVGFGLMAPAGTLAAGVAFVARDLVQDVAGRVGVVAVLAVGAALSWVVSTPALALASAAAFGLSELADMLVYTPLRDHGYVRAALASNVVGAVVDTLVFLSLAGFGLAAPIIAGQLVGKAWATITVVGLVVALRARRRTVPAA